MQKRLGYRQVFSLFCNNIISMSYIYKDEFAINYLLKYYDLLLGYELASREG